MWCTRRCLCPCTVAVIVISHLCYWTTITTMADPRTSVVREFCNNTRAAGSATIWADNFVVAFDKLSSDLQQKGYGMTSVGTDPITYYGLVQCLGDLSTVDCTLCYSEIRSLLPKCYPHIGGRIYLDGCFMRYANYSFFNVVMDSLDTSVCSAGNYSSDRQGFSAAVHIALSNVTSLAVKSNKGFAVSSASKSKKVSAYTLAQCWQNLNTSSCAACLAAAATSVARCAPAEEGRALFAGCYIRYSTRPFWNSKDSASNSTTSNHVVLWSVLGSCFGVLIVLVTAVLIWKKRTRRKDGSFRDLYASTLPARISQSCLNFGYKDLKKATGGFSLSNKLGQGSSGIVYKAVLSGGKEVAAKRLFLNTRQCIDQFFNEVDLISQVRHKNLVKLLGCSVDGPESFLIYEHHLNRSLDLFIFANSDDQSRHLDWQQRFDIIRGIAEGLCYLHEDSEARIIHRDIKASNILLDQKLKPKITDFGLARVLCTDQTHITTGVAGTVGYMAPEYVVHGQLTEKADVYSYGMLVMEVVTGKRCGSMGSQPGHSLLAKVWSNYKANTMEMMVDERIQYEQAAADEIMHVVQVGLQCTQANPSERPAMSRVVELLRNGRLDADFVLSDPPFIEIDTVIDIGEGEASKLLSYVSVLDMSASGSYSRVSGR